MHPGGGGGGDDSVWMEKVTGGVRRDRSSMENTFEQSFYHVWSVCMCETLMPLQVRFFQIAHNKIYNGTNN